MSTADLSRRTLRLRNLAILFGGFAVVALLVLGVMTVLQVRTDSERLLGGSKIAREQRDLQIALTKQVKALALHLTECTTRPDLRTPPVKIADLPEDDCYVQQQKGAADFASPTGPFGQLIIVSAACGAANPGDDKATLACVLRGLKR